MDTVKSYKGRLFQAILVALMPGIFAQIVVADAGLAFRRASDAQVDIVLRNDEPVAALQFTINTQGIELGEVWISGRPVEQAWTLSYHKVSDSTINVVLLRGSFVNLEAGEGVIASFSITGSGQSGLLTFSRIVVANPSAGIVRSFAEDFVWNSFPDRIPAQLSQNYPNPFNPSTTIPYRLNEPRSVRLSIYDITGREIARLIDELRGAGEHTAVWMGTDQAGHQVPSGIYFVRLQVGSEQIVKKMILSR